MRSSLRWQDLAEACRPRGKRGRGKRGRGDRRGPGDDEIKEVSVSLSRPMVIIRYPRHWTGVRTVRYRTTSSGTLLVVPGSAGAVGPALRARIFIETSHAAILSRRHALQIPPSQWVPPLSNFLFIFLIRNRFGSLLSRCDQFASPHKRENISAPIL